MPHRGDPYEIKQAAPGNAHLGLQAGRSSGAKLNYLFYVITESKVLLPKNPQRPPQRNRYPKQEQPDGEE